MSASAAVEKGEKMMGHSTAERGPAVDLDNILIEEVGQFGRYQLLTLALAALPVLFNAISSGEYIFTTARIPHRCRIPSCDGSASDVLMPEFRPDWLLNAVNGTSLTSFESCARFSDRSLQLSSNETCPADWFDQGREVDCDGYVYENNLSVVHDFDLGCNEWRRSRIGSIRTIGSVLGVPVAGLVSDRWGRRVVLTVATVSVALTGLARSLVNSYDWFLALEVLESAVGSGAFSSCYILTTELVGPKYRVMAGSTLSMMFATGNMILGLTAWNVPSWRPLTRLLYVPQLLIISYFWILSESVRWLMSKGRYEESEKILEKVAKVNNKQLSDKSRKSLRASTKSEPTENPKEPWLFVLVLKSPKILLRCIVSPVWWITNTLVYYGMNINAVNLSGNSYLNYVFVSAVEIPGFWTATLLLDRVGRKPLLICAYWLCAVCQFTFAFMPNGMENLSIVVYLIGKYCIAIVATSIYMYTLELYPTKYRHSLLAFSIMLSRIGSVTAPLTPALAQEVWEYLPSVLFGSFALVSGLLVFLTPETLGTKLPDTFEQAEQLSNRKTNN